MLIQVPYHQLVFHDALVYSLLVILMQEFLVWFCQLNDQSPRMARLQVTMTILNASCCKMSYPTIMSANVMIHRWTLIPNNLKIVKNLLFILSVRSLLFQIEKLGDRFDHTVIVNFSLFQTWKLPKDEFLIHLRYCARGNF